MAYGGAGLPIPGVIVQLASGLKMMARRDLKIKVKTKQNFNRKMKRK